MARTVTNDREVVTIEVNGHKTYLQAGQFTLGTLLTYHADILKYMSSDALLILLDQCADLMIEIGLHVKSANTTKEMVESFRKRPDPWLNGRTAWRYESPHFREFLQGIILEYIMRSEGMGSLSGFTYVRTIEGDSGGAVAQGNSIANPEKKSVNYL